MSLKQRSIVLQIIGCILFMLQPILLPSQPFFKGDYIFSNELLKNYLANALLIGFFYFNYYFLISRLYFRKYYLLYTLTIIAGLFIIVIFPDIVINLAFPIGSDFHPPFPPFPPTVPFHPGGPLGPVGPRGFDHLHESLFSQFQLFFSQVDHQAFLYLAIVFFSLMLRVRSRWYHTEKARREAEINYLSSQINPHFLFNALNSIYALTMREKATESAKSILKLSGLMRYVVTENRKEEVSMQNEINCVLDFIDFQKLRLADNIKLRCDIHGNFADKKIVPLLLLPFIENAFKHGVNPDEDSEIYIYIHVTDSELNLQVENNKVTANNDTIGKSGLGIENTKTRLELMYPGRHILKITSDDNFYKVILTIVF